MRLVHTPDMTLKTAALLAFLGTTLAAVLLLLDFVLDALNVAKGLLPAVKLFPELIYAFAAVTVATFFWAFPKGQR